MLAKVGLNYKHATINKINASQSTHPQCNGPQSSEVIGDYQVSFDYYGQ